MLLMPLGKADNPTTIRATIDTPKDGDHSATNAAIDAGAGAPADMRAAAEELPEGDPVKDGVKEAMLATDAQTEAKAKVKVIDDSSTGAEETPSGFALKAVAGIADDVKRGEEYARIKSAVRHGTVPADASDLKAKK
jgi:hypothetical protein